ncbi:MAG: glycosyltransferase family 2 protein [Promicromonosporaceae bacterium]|nr:glycosyltransferase family 2 protein [Promicromonosporaceae bacterium]
MPRLNPSELLATVVIPVYNGMGDHLAETLNATVNQELDGGFEIIVVDSGSHDGSAEFVRELAEKHPKIRLFEIPNSEFSHGGTRQWAAELARGEYVAYLSQDAIPASSDWLAKMLAGFSAGSRVGGVLGRQKPRPDCFPLQKHEINRAFAAQGPPDQYTVYDAESPDQQTARFYSDVCSAAPRDLLLNEVPYRNVTYAEDQAFGNDLITAGYQKVYAGPAVVVHSNDITLSEYPSRMLDEFRGLELAGVKIAAPTWRDLGRMTVKEAAEDARRAWHDPEYTRMQRVRYAVNAPLYRKARWLGQLFAATGQTQFSLERRRKMQLAEVES